MWTILPNLQETSHLHILMHKYISSLIQNQDPWPIPCIWAYFQCVDLSISVSRVKKSSSLVCVYQNRRRRIGVHMITEIIIFLEEQLPSILRIH